MASALCCAGSAFAASWTLTGGGMQARQRVRNLCRRFSSMPTKLPSMPLGRRQDRRVSVTRDMPVFLDIVTLGISAGLSLDASLELYCDRYDTSLAHLLSQSMLGWRMGMHGRGDALQLMADDMDIPAMSRFAAAVNDALAFGTPLADALERQAQVIRDEERSQIEEEIERVPVRMLIPLGVLIVPAMLLSILGPLLGPALGVA